MQATEALCHLSVTDIKKTFFHVWFFCKNEACANCTGWNATTVIWLLTVAYTIWNRKNLEHRSWKLLWLFLISHSIWMCNRSLWCWKKMQFPSLFTFASFFYLLTYWIGNLNYSSIRSFQLWCLRFFLFPLNNNCKIIDCSSKMNIVPFYWSSRHKRS